MSMDGRTVGPVRGPDFWSEIRLPDPDFRYGPAVHAYEPFDRPVSARSANRYSIFLSR